MAGTDSFTHRFVPATAPHPARTLLLLHGAGGNEDELIGLGHAVAPGAALLSPRGRVLEGVAPRFFRCLSKSVFDEADLREQTHALADFAAAAAAQYGFDPGALLALGSSGGASIAASLLLLHPETLAGAALLRPMMALPFEADAPGPARPVLILSGNMDPVVAPGQPERLTEQLRRAGASVTLAWQPSGHGLAAGEPATVARFIAGLPVLPPLPNPPQAAPSRPWPNLA